MAGSPPPSHQDQPGDKPVSDLSKITSIEDLRVIAKRRVPKMFYDYADSGAWTEGTYRANESDFQKIKLRQRVAVNMEGRSLRTTMVGQETAMPVAMRPPASPACSTPTARSSAPARPRPSAFRSRCPP
jgi:hypothetical protein